MPNVNNTNRVFVDGAVTWIDQKELPSGLFVSNFKFAVVSEWNGTQRKDVFDVEYFSEDRALPAVEGDQVFVEGRLRRDTWENADGESRSRIKIRASRVVKLVVEQSMVSEEEETGS